MFPRRCLREEGVEGVVRDPDRVVRRHLTVRMDPVLQAVQLPSGVAHLDAGLPDVDADHLALCPKKEAALFELLLLLSLVQS